MLNCRVFGAAIMVGACLMGASSAAARADDQVERQARPTCKGKVATIVGTNGNDTLRGTRKADVIVGLDGDDVVKAGSGADRVCVGGGDDVVIAGGGDDVVAGAAGSDIVIAGKGDDRMSGGSDLDGLLGMAGDDVYRGDAGALDLVAFLAAPRGVTADLARGTASGEGRDTLRGVEALMGSPAADRLLGNDALNALFSGAGADVLDGRGGDDYILLSNAPGPVEIDLGDDRYTGSGLAQRIEHVIGSPYDDTIYGDSAYNYLDGAEGNDAVDGIDGSDLCYAETIFSCRELSSTSEPPVDAGTVPGERAAGATDATRARPRGLPAGELDGLRAAAGAVRKLPASAPGTVSRSSTAYGFVNCPVMSRDALIGTFVTGSTGFFASRSSQGFGGWNPWRYSVPIYSDGTNYWYLVNGQWSGPYNIFNSGGFEWTEFVGVQLTAEAYWYSYQTQQYYYLGSCIGQGFHLGVGF